MRKITKEACKNFLAGKTWRRGNTAVTVFMNGDKYLFLHGNCIAHVVGNKFEITNAGWFSVTTKERLNGLPGVSITQKSGTWYLNGEVWRGDWKEILCRGIR